MTQFNANFERANSLYKEITALMQILDVMQEGNASYINLLNYGDHYLSKLFENINGMSKNELITMIMNKINFFHSQLKDFLNEYSI